MEHDDDFSNKISGKSSNSINGDNNTNNNATLPLPKGWSRGFSQSQQRTFYFYAATKHTQWHFPTASEARDPSKAQQRARDNVEREKQQQHHQSMNHHNMNQTENKKRDFSNLLSTSSSSRDVTDTSSSTAGSSSSSSSFKQIKTNNNNNHADNNLLDLDDLTTSVAIIVPFRDLHPEQHRAAHLRQFVPHMIRFFSKLQASGQVRDYHIYIVEQGRDDQRKFNRGKLLNIGFDYARHKQYHTHRRKHDVFIFHDVDLLPHDNLGPWYVKFPIKPIHIARVWDRYSNNPKYFGGVVSFSSSDYKRINGYPNTFWGWGGEDDEMHKRLEKLGMSFDAPTPGSGTLIDLEQMTLSEKLDFLRSHRTWKCMVKWEAAAEHDATWKTNGLSDLKYSVLETCALDESGKSTKITVDVKLNGTHWSNDKSSIDYAG